MPEWMKCGPDYAARITSEKEIYRDCLDVHELPGIFHYWSNRYVRPKLEAFGFSSPDEMFLKYARKHFQNGRSGARRLASMGAGNCHLEVELALHLRDTGCGDFIIDCLDLNPDMLERGRAAAAQAGVAASMNFLPVDLNLWTAAHEYDVVIANQTLHHVLNLENLFAEIRRSLSPDGCFVISDMIGRNGHQRWPEALPLVQEFWRKLPPPYRYNQGRLRYEEMYEDRDYSAESFEGIRAQDILPLLIEHFHFELFIAFANIIDPFVERAFGNNFDPSAAWDRSFIDQVHERDEQEIAAGRITPTHILAVMGTAPRVPTLFHDPISPEFCLRDPTRASVRVPELTAGREPAYELSRWPRDDRGEFEVAYRRLKGAQDRADEQARLAEERTLWAQSLDRELNLAIRRIGELDHELTERTQWAQSLNQDLGSAARRIGELDQELTERTQWARSLNRELESAARRIGELDGELMKRTQWAQSLDRELDELAARIRCLDQELEESKMAHRKDMDRLAWAVPIDRRFHASLDYSFRVVQRALQGVRRLLGG